MLEDCAPSLVAEAVLLYADPVASVEKTYHDHTLHNTIVPFHDGKTFVQKPNFTERPTDIGETNTKVHYVLSNDMREGLFDLSSYTTSVPQPIFGGAALPLHTKQNSNHTIENTSENSIRFLPDGTPLLSSLLGKEKVNSSNHTPSRLAELVRRSRQVSRYKRRYHATPCGRSGHVLHSLPTDYQPPLILIEYNLEKCSTLSTSGTEKERNEDRTRILLSLRASVSAGQVSEKGYMILFGGLTSENKSMNDTWLYVVEHGVWLEVPCTAEEDIPPNHHHNNDNDTNAPPAPPFEFDEDGFMIAPETVGSEIASSEDGRWQEAEEEEIYYEQPFYEDEDGVMENRLYNAETLLRLNSQINRHFPPAAYGQASTIFHSSRTFRNDEPLVEEDEPNPEKERENLYLLVAGGNTQTNQCSDGFFVLNLRTLVWVCLETNIGIEPFWGSTAQTLRRPDGREVMVLFSGMFDSGEIIERYYLIDPSKVCTSGRHHLHTEDYDLPRHFSGRRRASSAAVWDHYMIIFGGRNNQSEFFNDVWVFCLLTNGWTPLAASTPKELVQQYWHVAATPQLPNQVEQLDEISRVMMVRYEAELEVYEEKYTEALQYRWLSFIRAEFLKEDDQAVENGQMLPLEVLQNLVLAAVKNKMNDPNHTLPMPAATAEEFVASYQYLPAHLKREVKGKRHFHYSPVLPRTGSCAAFDPIRGIFFVYGGFFLAGFTRQATYMDLHAYYVRQHTWRSVCFSRQPYYHRDLENSPTQYSDLVKYLYSRPLTGENPYGGYIGEAKTDGAPSSLVGYLRRHLAPNQPKTERKEDGGCFAFETPAQRTMRCRGKKRIRPPVLRPPARTMATLVLHRPSPNPNEVIFFLHGGRYNDSTSLGDFFQVKVSVGLEADWYPGEVEYRYGYGMDTEPPNPQEREKKRTLMTKFVRWGEALRHSPLDGFAHLFSLRTTVLNYLRGTVLSPHYSTMIGPLLRFQSPAMGGDFQQQQQQLLELVRGALLNGEDGWGAHPVVYTLLGRCDNFIWPTGTALFLPGRDRRSMLTLKHRVITRVTGVDRVEE